MLGREDLLEDERFISNELRCTNQNDLAVELSSILRGRSSAEWLERLQQAGVPAGPINDVADVYHDPHVHAREMRVSLDHPSAGKVDHIGSPILLSRTPVGFRCPAPTLGQHTDEILAQIGLAESDIAHLRDEGVIG
jgi:crotonobetainyl-CoA:carnitine CoA-transferase CaiB-like acyl-CoA transferase